MTKFIVLTSKANKKARIINLEKVTQIVGFGEHTTVQFFDGEEIVSAYVLETPEEIMALINQPVF